MPTPPDGGLVKKKAQGACTPIPHPAPCAALLANPDCRPEPQPAPGCPPTVAAWLSHPMCCPPLPFALAASSRSIALYHSGSVVAKQTRTAFYEWFYYSLRAGAVIATKRIPSSQGEGGSGSLGGLSLAFFTLVPFPPLSPFTTSCDTRLFTQTQSLAHPHTCA